MKNAIFEPLAAEEEKSHGKVAIKSDSQEICSFTLEMCFLRTGAGKKEAGDELCPFTFEPVCMRTRAMSAGPE